MKNIKGRHFFKRHILHIFLLKRLLKNDGQIEQIRVKDNHDAIIDSELWEAV